MRRKDILTDYQRDTIIHLCFTIAENQGAGLPLDVLLDEVASEYRRQVNQAEQGAILADTKKNDEKRLRNSARGALRRARGK